MYSGSTTIKPHIKRILCLCDNKKATTQILFQNNPSEARTMLLQNPQLAYALLQAQVVMGIVDPHVAVVSLIADLYEY